MDEQQDTSLHFLDYWRVIRSRKEIVLAVTLLIMLTVTAFTFTLPKIYLAETRIEVNKDALDIDVFQHEFADGYDPFFLRTQHEIIRSRPILYQVIRDLNLQEVWGKQRGKEGEPLPLNIAYSLLSDNLSAQQYRDTFLISIQVKGEDPEEAARIVNQVTEVYREQRLLVKRREIRRALESLENEVEKQQSRVDQAEAELEKIRKDLGITVLGRGIQADKIRLQRLEGDRIGARVDMIVRKARLEQLQDLSGNELLAAAAYLVNDSMITTLRSQLVNAELNLRVLLEGYGENHPEVKESMAGRDGVRTKLADALSGLKKGLKADYEVARTRHEALESELTKAQRADITSETERYLPFNKIERRVVFQQEILNALRARIAQEGIELEVPRTPIVVVDPAEPPVQHISPNLLLNIALSLIIGLGAGIGLAFFIEYLDTSVKTVDDVERYLGLPVLGVIPQKVRPLIEEGPDSPHAEAYRVLRTNMQFSAKGMEGGAFAVISGGVGEGKSTTLFNLAYVCAQLGDKVLVVDSDLRRPVQHTILNMSNRFGLTNVLMRDVPIEETIKPTSMPNLHFLPSGKPPPRSSLGILDSQRMRELVKNLKARYDYVFFDSPPVLGVSDASILASEVDAVLMVVQYRKYPRTISTRVKRMLENVGANPIGVVLNNINILRDDYYYYYHSHCSHYYHSDEARPPEETPSVPAEQKEDAF